MTIDEALDFFAKYGGVGTDVEKLKATPPNRKQLETAGRLAILKGCSQSELTEAYEAVCSFFGLAFNPPEKTTE